MALRNFKEKKSSQVAKEMLEEKIYILKDKNERQMAKVAQRKALIEAAEEKKRNELLEIEKREMSPIHGLGSSVMLRTFNASANHNAGGFYKMRHSMGSFPKNLGREESDQVLSISDAKQGRN